VKGKIVAHAFVLAGEDAFSLLMVPESAARLIPHLDRYIIREDVTLGDESGDVDWTLVLGAKSGDAIGKLFSVDPVKLDRPWSHVCFAMGGDKLCLQFVHCDLPWCGGYLNGCAANERETVSAMLREGGVVQCATGVWHAVRIESAWPLEGADFDGGNLPQEVGRDAAAINFRKGCYLGQETIARIDALGHVNKRIVQVRFSGEAVPEGGQELVKDGQSVGRVTSSCWSPRHGAPLALAMVKRGADEPGVQLQCGAVGAEVLPSPALI
jgi:folate-binding protein YgfZ